MQHVRSYFPHQGSNSHPLQWLCYPFTYPWRKIDQELQTQKTKDHHKTTISFFLTFCLLVPKLFYVFAQSLVLLRIFIFLVLKNLQSRACMEFIAQS